MNLSCKLGSHSWIHLWADETKRCLECDIEKPIEKDYDHDDPDAEIGDVRYRVEERENTYRVDQMEYQNTAHGSDKAFFQWFPAGGFYADEEELTDLRDEIDEVLDDA